MSQASFEARLQLAGTLVYKRADGSIIKEVRVRSAPESIPVQPEEPAVGEGDDTA